MKLFRISQNIHNGYDTYSDAVVVAPDEATAKTIHPDQYEGRDPWPFVPNADDSNYPRNDWADTPDQVKAEYIGEAVEHLSQGAVICASYHAG
jgi:hypothetical protein